MPIIYSLEINPLSSMKNVYTALENDQVYNFWIFLFLLKVDYVGTRNRSKMLTAAQSWLSPEELGPDDTSGVKEELDLPSSKSKQSEHVTKGACTFNSGSKILWVSLCTECFQGQRSNSNPLRNVCVTSYWCGPSLNKNTNYPWCQQTHFKTCNHIQPIKGTANCKTANVVYVIACIKCRNCSILEKQGMSFTYKWTAINWILNIDVWKSRWLIFLDLKAIPWRIFLFFVIEQIHREEVNFRKTKESRWIQTLQSLAPEGLNLGP